MAGEEYDAAASVLDEIDFDYLRLWGHAQFIAGLRERLVGRLTDTQLILGNLGNLGNCYYSLGDYPRAIEHQEQALAIDREIGNRYGKGTGLTTIGDVYRDTGQPAQALEQYRGAIGIADETGNRQNRHEARFGLALAQLFADDLAEARAVYSVAVDAMVM